MLPNADIVNRSAGSYPRPGNRMGMLVIGCNNHFFIQLVMHSELVENISLPNVKVVARRREIPPYASPVLPQDCNTTIRGSDCPPKFSIFTSPNRGQWGFGAMCTPHTKRKATVTPNTQYKYACCVYKVWEIRNNRGGAHHGRETRLLPLPHCRTKGCSVAREGWKRPDAGAQALWSATRGNGARGDGSANLPELGASAHLAKPDARTRGANLLEAEVCRGTRRTAIEFGLGK